MKLQTFTYVDGIDEAVAFYLKVFDAMVKESYLNKDGTYNLCEIGLARGISFWVAERKGISAIEGDVNTGNIMQMCVRYDKTDIAKLEKAYQMLKENALNLIHSLQAAPWTSHSCDLIDKYGLRWCLMVG
ncbi:MAG: VOC family protein [Firmicutes bacterium]|nr:VOC family protein [Bacillota bacterium]